MTITTIADLIALLQSATRDQIDEIRRILGIGGFYVRKDIDTFTGQEKERDRHGVPA